MYILFLPLIAIGIVVIPFIVAIKRQKDGKTVNAKKTVLANVGSFFGCMIVFTLMFTFGAFADAGTAVASAGIGEGLKYLGAALSTGLATIGTGIAVGGAAPAAIGATSEDEKNFTKALIFVALGEGVAIYGLLISILILFS